MKGVKKKMYVILFLLVVLIFIFGFTMKDKIVGSVIIPYRIFGINDGIVEIEMSKLNDCCTFDKDGAVKVCAVFEGYNCDYCEDCINNEGG